jgi:hypothetical protein
MAYQILKILGKLLGSKVKLMIETLISNSNLIQPMIFKRNYKFDRSEKTNKIQKH